MCLSALWAVVAPPIHAEPSIPAAPLPGLESDPAGTVTPEFCAVSVMAGKATVELTVRADAEAPALLLNGPQFGWSESEPYPDRHFPELEIRVDGVLNRPDDSFEAVVGKMNITNLLRAAGMDPWAITRTPPVTSADPNHPQVLNGLKNAGAIVNADDGYLAKWTARRLLRIALKAVPEQRVELKYTVRPGHAWLTPEQLVTTSREKTYCVSSKALRRVLHSAADSTVLTVNEYTIPTGIDGKPPSSVTFTMLPGAGDGVTLHTGIFLCGPHGKPIAKDGPVTRERAEVDDLGNLHVLSAAEPPPAAPAR